MDTLVEFARFLWKVGAPFWLALAATILIFLIMRLGPTVRDAVAGIAKDVWTFWKTNQPPKENHSDDGGPEHPDAVWNDGAGPREPFDPDDAPPAVVVPNKPGDEPWPQG